VFFIKKEGKGVMMSDVLEGVLEWPAECRTKTRGKAGGKEMICHAKRNPKRTGEKIES